MKIDKSNMRQVIIDSADQLKEGLTLAENIKIDGDFKNIVICGMGGSALPADILNITTNLEIPVYIHRGYNLGEKTNEHSLVICISYSGNTEETLSAINEAINRKLKVIGISSNGEIETVCKKNTIPFVKIPAGIQPRCAIGYIYSALIKVLINCNITKDISSEIIEASQKVKEISNSLEVEGKKLAKKLLKKVPVIYSSENFKDLAKIWKIKFNENSKTPAFYNYFPELNHNEMVGYGGLKRLGFKNFHVIILQDVSDHPRILKRIKLTADLIRKNGAKVEIVAIQSGSVLFKIFSTLLLGDWVSYYLALENKIDPTPVQIVEEFKGQMKK